jgi:hypothetical protein
VGLESSEANHHFASVCVEAARKGSTIFEYLKTPKSAAVAAWGGDRFDDDDDDAEFTPVGVLQCKNFLTHRLRPTSVTIGEGGMVVSSLSADGRKYDERKNKLLFSSTIRSSRLVRDSPGRTALARRCLSYILPTRGLHSDK